jgi:hypothetical protein
MTWLLEGHRATAVIDYLANSTLGYAFGRGGSTILALWDFSGTPRTYTLDTGVASVEIYDWMGNKTTTATSNGMLTISVGTKPVYVKGVSQSLWGIDRQNYNIARGKAVTTSGDSDGAVYPASNAVDGTNSSNNSRWISAVNLSSPHWIEIHLQENHEIDEIRFWTGSHQDYSGNYHFNTAGALDKYRLQYWDGSSYRTIPGGDVTAGGNSRAAVRHTFSPLTTSKVRLFMPAPYSTSQIRLYEIEIRSTTPVSDSELVYEAESLGASVSGGGTTLVTDANASAGKWVRFDAVATGDWIEFTLPNVSAGIYTVEVRQKTHSSRGKYQTSIDGVDLGTVVDQYAGTATYPEITLGSKGFTSDGNQRVRFLVVGKHAGSSGFNIAIDAIVLTRIASGPPREVWRHAWFSDSERANPAISGDGADPEDDGVANLVEYVTGSDPRKAEPLPATGDAVLVNGAAYFEYSWRRNKNASDVAVAYERSADLTIWEPTVPDAVSSVPLSNQMEQVEARWLMTDDPFFLRLNVTVQP